MGHQLPQSRGLLPILIYGSGVAPRWLQFITEKGGSIGCRSLVTSQRIEVAWCVGRQFAVLSVRAVSQRIVLLWNDPKVVARTFPSGLQDTMSITSSKPSRKQKARVPVATSQMMTDLSQEPVAR